MAKSKKRYYKRKFGQKGVRYIANSLNKYFKGQYPNYTSALEKAREINSRLKSEKKRVVLANIFPSVRKTRSKKASVNKEIAEKKHSGSYDITDELLVEQYYFTLVDYPTWIALCSNNIYFYSEISPAGLDPIRGGELVSEELYFSDYLSFCNERKSRASDEGQDKRYTSDWFVMCTEPIPDGTGNYKSKIISVDSDGNPIDYGFNPQSPSFRPEEQILVDVEDEESELEQMIDDEKSTQVNKSSISQQDIDFLKVQNDIKSKEEMIERHKVALARQENIAMYGRWFEDGKISLSEFKSMTRDL